MRNKQRGRGRVRGLRRNHDAVISTRAKIVLVLIGMVLVGAVMMFMARSVSAIEERDIPSASPL